MSVATRKGVLVGGFAVFLVAALMAPYGCAVASADTSITAWPARMYVPPTQGSVTLFVRDTGTTAYTLAVFTSKPWLVPERSSLKLRPGATGTLRVRVLRHPRVGTQVVTFSKPAPSNSSGIGAAGAVGLKLDFAKPVVAAPVHAGFPWSWLLLIPVIGALTLGIVRWRHRRRRTRSYGF